ncbi:MAG: OB-fold nucleic acid binding domain-containing protein [Acidobacteria bacterium]|nr:OB-fold nucleic acid binding domain-containing protein [Acidobacteriota bacterium]
MTKRLLVFISLVVLIGVAGCSSQPAAKIESTAQTQAAPQRAAPASASPAAEGPNAAPQTVTGTVMETMNASNYTYLRVKVNTADVWVATAQFKAAVGDKVVVPLEMPMQNFHSQSLKRDFPLIYFVSRVGREGETMPPAMQPQMQPAMMSAHGSTPAYAPAGAPPPAGEPQAKPAQAVINVAPAAGGMTVADVWTKRKTLGGKTVTIRGRVVKFNGGILGVNWLHLQDGTGTAKDGTNDITVTSQAAAKVGEVITVTGKIALDKDLGSGYSYAVILEGATIIVK